MAKTEARKYADHDLPMLRVHRALNRAGEMADEAGVDRRVVERIAQEVVSIIGEGTTRWGYLCPHCRQQIVREDSGLVCPKHGPARSIYGVGAPLTLLVTFDPLNTDGRPESGQKRTVTK